MCIHNEKFHRTFRNLDNLIYLLQQCKNMFITEGQLSNQSKATFQCQKTNDIRLFQLI